MKNALAIAAAVLIAAIGFSNAVSRLMLVRYERALAVGTGEQVLGDQAADDQSAAENRPAPPAGVFGFNRASAQYHHLLGKYHETKPNAAPGCGAALAAYRRAQQLSPTSARHYVAWAAYAVTNAAAVLEYSGITAENLKAQIIESLEHAAEFEPYNTVEQYYSALVYLNLGEKARALSLLQKNEELNPLFTDEQRRYFYGLIRNEQDLEAALGTALPAVAGWISYFATEQPLRFMQWQSVFARAAERSVKRRLSDLNSQGLTADKLRRDPHYLAAHELFRYPRLVFTDSLRCSLDTLLAKYYQLAGDYVRAEFFAQRSELVRIPVAKAVAAYDHLPGHSMLYNWTVDTDRQYLQVANLGTSLGFFVPVGYRAKLLVIESDKYRRRRDFTDFALRISRDNREFALVSKPQARAINVRRRSVLAVELPNEDFKFAKFALTSGSDVGFLRNELSELVQVYGERADE